MKPIVVIRTMVDVLWVWLSRPSTCLSECHRKNKKNIDNVGATMFPIASPVVFIKSGGGYGQLPEWSTDGNKRDRRSGRYFKRQ